ncbi:unannotated protein [freshwater metagenome]|uniref:Unannotated protein n=1 Tax=freshwater metagenome TaxID=449393 RepID=A0A6J6C8H4_9ZZZZ
MFQLGPLAAVLLDGRVNLVFEGSARFGLEV